jgi:hypothetical protein
MFFNNMLLFRRFDGAMLEPMAAAKKRAIQLQLLKEEKDELEAPKPDFVKIEKNLNSLGFFTPGKHNGVRQRKKTIRIRREINGRTVDAEATILPSAEYGLPTAADLDKYLAFQKIVESKRTSEGTISNPVGFTTAQLVNVLGINTTGKNYKDVHDWLQRMTLTGINSKGTVYLAQKKAWMSDTFHVFDRVVTVGTVLADESVADKNYVWLSEWQLENINGNYLLPIDFETYRQLNNQIAKIMVPLLQVWLYASRMEGRFEKRYDELCQILDIAHHPHLSVIRRQLEPSLAELQHHGYLADYAIELTADGDEYKIVAVHGPKFYDDQKLRAALPTAALTEAEFPARFEPLVAMLVERGIVETQARKLLDASATVEAIQGQIEYADYVVGIQGPKMTNPSGFYVWVLRENLRPPANFETSAQRRQREERKKQKQAEEIRLLAEEEAYDRYCREKVEAHLATLSEREMAELNVKYFREVKAQWPKLPQATLRDIARCKMEKAFRSSLQLMSFESFVSNPQAALFE